MKDSTRLKKYAYHLLYFGPPMEDGMYVIEHSSNSLWALQRIMFRNEARYGWEKGWIKTADQITGNNMITVTHSSTLELATPKVKTP